jgi:hypothetical protein
MAKKGDYVPIASEAAGAVKMGLDAAVGALDMIFGTGHSEPKEEHVRLINDDGETVGHATIPKK